MTGDDEVPLAEDEDRMARILSVACPKCGQPPGRMCKSAAGFHQVSQHAARWDAWYAAHPEAAGVEPPRAETDCICGGDCPCEADGPDGLCACCRTGEHRGSCADPDAAHPEAGAS